MLGEVVFGAPAILEPETVGVAVRADLIGEQRIERNQKLSARQLDDGTEADAVGFAICGLLVSALEGQGDAVPLALDQRKLGFHLDAANIEILMQWLLGAQRKLHEPPVGRA